MSTRVQLTLLLSVFVLLALTGAFVVVRGWVFGPFAREVIEAHLDQVVYVAEEVERGADPAEIGQRLGLDIRLSEVPPGFVRRARGPRGKRCLEEVRRGHELIHCPGPRAPVAVRGSTGWIVVRRELDEGRPAERLGPMLLLVAGLVIATAVWLAGRLLQPLRTTVGAMNRMAAGDLSHRLEPKGGRDLKEVAVAFNAMADRVDLLLRAEKELMAGISHELRTPLARLRLELEILRDQATAAPKRLDAMERDLVEMDRLIGELLELSRLSIGMSPLELSEVDLDEVVAEARQRQPLPDHSVTVSGAGARLRADRSKLVRLVANLLQNAEKYAPKGSEVEIALDGHNLEVRDRGPGVPTEELDRIFEPFFRGARGRGPSATGVGLGLMIARQVAELHGGTITAANRPDGGLAVRLTLP